MKKKIITLFTLLLITIVSITYFYNRYNLNRNNNSNVVDGQSIKIDEQKKYIHESFLEKVIMPNSFAIKSSTKTIYYTIICLPSSISTHLT